MATLTSMHRAVQFIEQNLKAPVSVQDAADAAGYSLFHFSRTFSRIIGHSPYDYLMRRRLSKSARDLVASEKRIIDVAFEYQFNSPETYSRAFRRMFGLLPSQVTKSQTLPQGLKPEAALDYIRHINKGDYLVPELVALDTTHLVGLASRAGAGAEADLWDQLGAEMGSIPHRLEPGTTYGVSFHAGAGDAQPSSRLSRAEPREARSRGAFFLLGVPVESLDAIPPTLVGKSLPPLSYARFIHKGRTADLQLTLDYIFGTWLQKSGQAIAAPLWLAIYGERYTGPHDPDSEYDVLVPAKELDLPPPGGRLPFKGKAHTKGERRPTL